MVQLSYSDRSYINTDYFPFASPDRSMVHTINGVSILHSQIESIRGETKATFWNEPRKDGEAVVLWRSIPAVGADLSSPSIIARLCAHRIRYDTEREPKGEGRRDEVSKEKGRPEWE
jgi:hypothetical protein